MLYNIGYTNTKVIYWHSTVITKVMLLYKIQWRYDHGMAVNYCGHMFYNMSSGVYPWDYVKSCLSQIAWSIDSAWGLL